MKQSERQEAFQRILKREDRYARQAFAFVQEAVSHATREMKREAEGEIRHITGQELLNCMRELALRQYGPLTNEVLADWGIRQTEDFGRIVFLLVEENLLGASEEDSKADFAHGYDFHDAFIAPFLPDDNPLPPQEPVYQANRT